MYLGVLIDGKLVPCFILIIEFVHLLTQEALDFLLVDVISAIAFQKGGEYLAVGDRGGRVVIFERKDEKDVRTSFLSFFFLFLRGGGFLHMFYIEIMKTFLNS